MSLFIGLGSRLRGSSGVAAPPVEPTAFSDEQWTVDAEDQALRVNILSLPSSGGTPITDIEYQVDGTAWISSGETSGFLIPGLTNGQAYSINIRPVNAIGSGPEGVAKVQTPAVVTAPEAFQEADWSVSPVENGATVTITSLPENGGDTITNIEYRLNGASWVSSGGSVSFQISGLTNGAQYSIEIRASNSVGAGAASDTKQFTPADAAVLTDLSASFGDARITVETDSPDVGTVYFRIGTSSANAESGGGIFSASVTPTSGAVSFGLLDLSAYEGQTLYADVVQDTGLLSNRLSLIFCPVSQIPEAKALVTPGGAMLVNPSQVAIAT